MKALILTVLLATLGMGQSMSSSPFGLDLGKEKITVVDLWQTIGSPDSINKLGETNLIYHKGPITFYLLVDVVYSIEIKGGKYEHLNIGMKKKEILKKLGEVSSEPFSNREILEYTYGKDINYTMTLEVKDNKLTKIYIMKKI